MGAMSRPICLECSGSGYVMADDSAVRCRCSTCGGTGRYRGCAAYRADLDRREDARVAAAVARRRVGGGR